MTGYESKKAMAQDKLAQPAQEPVAIVAVDANADEMNRVHGEAYGFDWKYPDKTKAAQPAQEPWRESASDYERGVIDGRQKQAQSSVDKAVNRMAQRPWVDLTDEDWKEIEDMPDTFDQGVAWCLARLKDKNNG